MQLQINDKFLQDVIKILKIKNKHLIGIIAFFEEFFNRADKHHLYLLSAGIAFNILLYLIPLLLVAVYAVNFIFGAQDISTFLINIFKDILPPGDKTSTFLNSIIIEVLKITDKSSVAGIIGLVSLLWLSSLLIGSIRSGLNIIFHIPAPQVFFIYRIKDMFLTIALSLLFMLTIYIIPIVSFTGAFLGRFIHPSILPYFSRLFLLSVSLSTSFVLFYLLFSFVPNVKISRYIRLLSTALCVALIEVSRYAFAFYINGVSTYGTFYGTYALLALMAVWVYYLSMIILFSAEFSKLFIDTVKN
jgi:membrane protein